MDGVLADDEILGLATDLQQDALVEPMMELRARQVGQIACAHRCLAGRYLRRLGGRLKRAAGL